MNSVCFVADTASACAAWAVRLRLAGNGLLGVSFLCFGLSLLTVVAFRPDIVLRRLRTLCGLIAVGSGITHLLTVAGMITHAMPVILVNGVIRLVVGVLAAGAAGVMLWAMPRFLVLPSNTSLQRANQKLKAAEAATAEANQWLTLSERIANVGHWRLRPRTRTLICSDELYRILGRAPAPGPIDVRAIRRFWHPDDRKKLRRAALAALRDQTGFTAEVRIVRPNGQVRHILVRALYRPPEDGKPSTLFGICLDRTEQTQIQQELEHARAMAEQAMRRLSAQALQDSLTGLANRRRFDSAIESEFRRVKRLGLPLALVMLDVDHFKQYNDLYGHPAGDECLHAIAAEIARPLRRPGDLAARYGGEELAILMPGIPLATAAIIAARMVRAVRALAIEHLGSPYGIVTVSAGVAAIRPTLEELSPAPLLRNADKALYDAKHAGRNQVCVSHPREVASRASEQSIKS